MPFQNSAAALDSRVNRKPVCLARSQQGCEFKLPTPAVLPRRQSVLNMRAARHAQEETRKRASAGLSPRTALHGAPLPSDVLIEMKEVLSVGVGPRTEAELPTAPQLRSLLVRVFAENFELPSRSVNPNPNPTAAAAVPLPEILSHTGP
ncbi:hypothetical protein CRUP_017029 [Coryphaenoides rupestris]|nr:hypothetical protein CRUP_017029 [Coryphaenoides rupestris]